MALAAWLHNLDPIIVHLGRFPIRWYGLSYIAGFFLAFLIIKRICRVGVSTLKPEHAADLVVAVAFGILLGGRLGYVLLYQPSYLYTFTDTLPYWDLLAINKGGMASHGGMLGGMLGCLYYARRHKHNPLHLIDLMAFTAPLGIFLGRCANFINGELLGRPCRPNFPLAVKFPQEMYDMPVEKLDAIYAALPPIGTVTDRVSDWDPDVIIALIRQGNQAVIHAVEPLLTARHPSQLYAGVSEGLLVMAVLLIVWARPRKPGIIAGTFAIVYAFARISDEFFRMPDAHLINKEFAVLHITRGQWLSGLLMLFGAALIGYSLKTQREAMGGWRKRSGGLGSGV